MFDPDCTRCLLHQASKSVCVGGNGPQPCEVMLVGEALGANEEIERLPFVGDAGKLLDSLIEQGGSRRTDVYVSNVVKCRPPGNRNPTKDELDACRLYLIRELEVVRPKVIIALGGVAAKGLIGKDKVGESRGHAYKLLPEYRYDCPVYVTYHPASTMYANAAVRKGNIVSDLRLAFKIAWPPQVDMDIYTDEVSSDAKMRKALARLAQAKVIAVDCEWEVLREGGSWPWSKRDGRLPDFLSTAVAGRADDGHLVGVAIKAGSKWEGPLRKIVARVQSIYHNAAADLVWMYAKGWMAICGGDTLLLASMLNVEGSLKLDILAGMYTALAPDWKGATKETLGQRPARAGDWERLLDRNARDAVATILLNDSLLDEVERRGREAVMPLYSNLLAVTETLAHAAIVGYPFDVEVVNRLLLNSVKVQKRLRNEIAEDLDVPGYATKESGSQERMARALEGKLKKRLDRTEKTKKPSIAKDSLAPHAGHPIVDKIISLGALSKMEGTYLAPWVFMLDQQGNNRLHTVSKLWVARTGRSSAEADTGGTLQQFPRDKRIRKLIKADEGWDIFSCDESQIELRIAAWLAKEETMLRFFREGKDLHMMTAAYVRAAGAGQTVKEFLVDTKSWEAVVTPDERQGAKPVNFGFLFGAQEMTFIEQAKKDYGITFTFAQAKVFRDGFFELYPGLEAYHSAGWQWVEKGYVDTPLGRRRPIERGMGEDDTALLRKVINTPVQSVASDLSLLGMDLAARRFTEQGLHSSAQVFGFIHDDAIGTNESAKREQVRSILKDAMENPPLAQFGVELPIPLVADVEFGPTWAEVK